MRPQKYESLQWESMGSVCAWRTLCRKAAPHIGIAADSTQSGAASSCHVFPSEKCHITQ
jgi:hypothetical protein